ncbi:hypothetical protein VpasPP24_99 [Vibrio phage Vpas_PP24]|nr:hypothetical protein VpasPP24_99 [Vibrio phage Vpas_PP24]
MTLTLRKYQSSPLFMPMYAGATPFSAYAKVLSAILAETDYANNNYVIEEHALEFYSLNHLVGLKRLAYHPDEPIDPSDYPLLDMYQDALSHIAMIMFSYILVCCTREARHRHADIDEQVIPDPLLDFVYHLQGRDSVKILEDLSRGEINCTLGEFAECLVAIFEHGCFEASYGGQAWLTIAEHLRKYVDGVISTESFLDGCFHLSHNTGYVFNKGIIYSACTGDYIRILDVQAGGYIPNLIANRESELGYKFISPTIDLNYPILDLCVDYPPVPWDRVLSTKTDQSYDEYFKSISNYTSKAVKELKPTIEGVDLGQGLSTTATTTLIKPVPHLEAYKVTTRNVGER